MEYTNGSSLRTTEQPSQAKEPKSPYVLLFILLIIAAIATWVIPAGEYVRVVRDGISFVVPNSLESMPQHGAAPLSIFTAIAEGMKRSAPIILLILFTGGALGVLEKTGAITQALKGIASSSRFGDFTVILLFSLVFSLLGTTGVVANAVIAFVPIGLLVARSLGLDKTFGVCLVYLTCASGFNVAVTSPATTGLTQRLAQLPLFSGIGLRGATFAMFLVATVIFITLYVRRCRANGQLRPTAIQTEHTDERASRRHWLALGFASVCLVSFIVGAVRLKWGETEMMAMFIIMAIGSGIICQLSSSAIANHFISGSSKLVGGALIVGMAQAISVVLQAGYILDPIVDFISRFLADLHPAWAAISMFVSAALMHFAISSGSGESALLIPIFSPIGDNIGLTRQVTVQAVLLGEGIVNCINPTSGVLMGVLATAGVPFGKWVRFVMPLIAVWTVICVIMLVIGVAIKWGPF